MMGKVLVLCECSGTVRDAFLDAGHDAWSCDVKADEKGSNRHFRAKAQDVLSHPDIFGFWDLVIVAHPPCTRLCNSGARWLIDPPDNAPSSCTPEESDSWPDLDRDARLAMIWRHLDDGAALFDLCLNSGATERVAVENPVMHKHAKQRINFGDVTPFYVQPWHFADCDESPDNEKKRTGFWARGLPKLEATGSVDGSTARSSVHHASPGNDRATERSRFFPGMAQAMADQWGALLPVTPATESF